MTLYLDDDSASPLLVRLLRNAGTTSSPPPMWVWLAPRTLCI
jgi:hypothetical protein